MATPFRDSYILPNIEKDAWFVNAGCILRLIPLDSKHRHREIGWKLAFQRKIVYILRAKNLRLGVAG